MMLPIVNEVEMNTLNTSNKSPSIPQKGMAHFDLRFIK